jgi:hypothetical protein
VYTNATLPVIQRIEAAAASAEQGVYVASHVRDDPRYTATECSLETIVRSVKASVNSSVYKETTLEEWTETKEWHEPGSPSGYYLLPNWTQSLGMHPGQNFTLSPNSHATITAFMKSLFSGKAKASMHGSQFVSTANGFGSYATTDAMQAFVYGNITGCADTKHDRFGCAMRNVADAMSKSFRDQAYINNEADMAVGHTHVNVTVIHVHWQWLTLPLLVWLLSAVTWLGTEWKTHRGKLQKWSDNPLPLLFLYRDGEDSQTDQVQGLSGQAYERRAKSIHTRLYLKENHAALEE